MVKSFYAVGCTNRKTKGSTLLFPTDNDRRSQLIAATSRKDWSPTGDQKTNDPLSPDYVPSIFEHISALSRNKRRNNFKAYCRTKNVFKIRLKITMKEEATKRQQRIL